MINIEKIRIESSDWLYNAGINGVVNILKFNNDSVCIEKDYIEFDSDVLNNFEEKYFKCIYSKYKKFTSWHKIISFEEEIDKYRSNNGIDEKDLENINKHAEYTKTKLKSNSYKSAYELIKDKSVDLISEEKNLKKITIKKKESLDDVKGIILNQIETIDRIINYLKKDEVKKYILAKNITYDVVDAFWSGVSFLHPTSSNKNMYEEYKSYFIDPTLNYMQEDRSKYKYKCFSCNNEISKFSKPSSYDLVWINKLGVDVSRKSSHFWNLNCDTYICPICNLVYSCIPAGFTTLYKKGFFVNDNNNLKNLVIANKHSLDNGTTLQQLEDKSYFAIIDNMVQNELNDLEKETNNIQIIKLDNENSQRPYTFNVLSKDKLNLINKNKNILKNLINERMLWYVDSSNKKHYKNIYKESIDRLYNNKNQFDLIYEMIKKITMGAYQGYDKIEMILKLNDSFLGGIMESKSISSAKIFRIRSLGNDLKKAYKDKKTENKLGAISYRLLNALKTKDSSKFMDTLINSYMYLNKEIPLDFIDALNDVDVFQSVGYAFLLGLEGEQYNKKSGEEA